MANLDVDLAYLERRKTQLREAEEYSAKRAQEIAQLSKTTTKKVRFRDKQIYRDTVSEGGRVVGTYLYRKVEERGYDRLEGPAYVSGVLAVHSAAFAAETTTDIFRFGVWILKVGFCCGCWVLGTALDQTGKYLESREQIKNPNPQPAPMPALNWEDPN